MLFFSITLDVIVNEVEKHHSHKVSQAHSEIDGAIGFDLDDSRIDFKSGLLKEPQYVYNLSNRAYPKPHCGALVAY